MSLTPLDVRKQQFRRVLRGFDPDEVRVFLNLVAGEMERHLQEHEALTEQVMAYRSRLEEYGVLERNLRDALVAAQGVREEARRQAERESELVLARAELEAEGRLRASEVRLADLRREMAELKGERQNYLIRLRALIDTHMRMVEASEAQFEALDLASAPNTVIRGPDRGEAEEEYPANLPGSTTSSFRPAEHATDAPGRPG